MGRLGAVGGESRNDLGDISHVLAGIDASSGSENSSDGELHFEGCFCWELSDYGRILLGGRVGEDEDSSDRKKRVKLT